MLCKNFKLKARAWSVSGDQHCCLRSIRPKNSRPCVGAPSVFLETNIHRASIQAPTKHISKHKTLFSFFSRHDSYVCNDRRKKELYNELVIVSWVQGLIGYLQTDGEKKSHTLFDFFFASPSFRVSLPVHWDLFPTIFPRPRKSKSPEMCIKQYVTLKSVYIRLVLFSGRAKRSRHIWGFAFFSHSKCHTRWNAPNT